jgi:signal peptide peptidase SppA
LKVEIPITPTCFASHMGLWLIDPMWFQAALDAVRAGGFPTADPAALKAVADAKPYDLCNGVAVVPIVGQMQKGFTKFGGTSTVATRQALRLALSDPAVGSIMLAVDSPGGTVAGTEELAHAVREADKVKPVVAHVEDTGASAAYWVASQARRVTAAPTAEVGSIGTVAVVADTSGAAALEGVKVHVIATGPFKGAGFDGAPITDDQLATIRDRVVALNEHFLAAVAGGRKVSPEKVRNDWADGRVWIAGTAKSMGLVDGVERFDAALAHAADLAKPTVGRDMRSEISRRQIAVAEKNRR